MHAASRFGYGLLLISGFLLLWVGTANAQTTYFEVTLENTSPAYTFANSGAFAIPDGATEAGPLFPGNAYIFSVCAAPGSYLSLATMYVQSNDVFLAPNEMGIPLWDADGNPVSGDITDQFQLWDAGSEVNEAPGEGANQAPRQSGPNTGDDENGIVQLLSAANDGYTYASVADVAQITLTPTGENTFEVRIENVSGSDTQTTSGGGVPVPLSPGVWVVHNAPAPLFTAGEADRGEGLEAIAEDGNPGELGAALEAVTGITQIYAPGVWAVHAAPAPLFTSGEADRGEGLEAIAEDGNPGMLAGLLSTLNETTGGAFAVPDGAEGPGPLTPGHAYRFVIGAKPGSYLSAASMLVQSNDLFVAPDEMGIPLWNADGPISGDITGQFLLWDAGTELNEKPGFGRYQAPRQPGPDMGMVENGAVRLVDDGYTYPDLADILKVTITPVQSVPFTIRLENVSTASTITTSTGQMVPVPLAPGVWVVHAAPAPLFKAGEADRGLGLEGVAEDGAAGMLGESVAQKIGFDSAVFNTPVGAAGPGPLFPGDAYEFTVNAVPGAHLSFATMFVQSNDLFYAPGEMGIPLFDADGNPISGDLTAFLELWDAGTEVNEEPGEGPNQAPRQSAGNTGEDENGIVDLVANINDGFAYPAVSDVISVTVTPVETAIEDLIDLPKNFSLDQNYPNPFNPETRIRFSLEEAGPVQLSVFNTLGQEIARLVDTSANAGVYEAVWNGRDAQGQEVSTGVYLYRLQVGEATQVRKMVLLR